MVKRTLLISLFASLVFAQNFEDYNKAQTKAFEDEKKLFQIHQKSQDEEFENYKKAQDIIFNEYKKEVKAVWKTPKMSTKTEWVAYSDDKKTRTNVDFSNETIVVETIASSQKEATKKLQDALKKVVTVDNKTFTQTDPLEKRLSKIKKPFGIVDDKPENEPIISNMIFKTKPTNSDINKYVEKSINTSKIEVIKSNTIKQSKVYTVKIQMPKDALVRKSKQYYKDVKKQALRQKLPISLVFAIMHSESSFNPRARSYIPAYGLMQIVPKTAGIDAYRYLYKKKRLVSSSYLYNSKNNITIGSAYIHILYYKYFKNVKNPQSRLYCTIAAYNTGSGNVAWAFVRKHSMDEAAPIINKMSPEEVYAKLIKDLRYKEAKRYLQKVSKRVDTYNKVYQSQG